MKKSIAILFVLAFGICSLHAQNIGTDPKNVKPAALAVKVDRNPNPNAVTPSSVAASSTPAGEAKPACCASGKTASCCEGHAAGTCAKGSAPACNHDKTKTESTPKKN